MAIENLIKQIQGQGITSKWSGGYGPDAATQDMARILSGIGITDIRQFGKIPKYEPVEVMGWSYNGRRAADENTGLREAGTDQFGDTVYESYKLPAGQKATPQYGTQSWAQGDDGGGYSYLTPVSNPEAVTTVNGKPVLKVGETYGNKVTGQEVPLTYSERQTGNAWGGTFEGSGNTGYRVDFTPEGTPIFYTTGASSSNIGDYAPLLIAGGLALGAPMLGELFGAAGAGAGAGLGAAELTALDLAIGGGSFAVPAEIGAIASGVGSGLLGGAEGLGLEALDLAIGGGSYAVPAELSSALAAEVANGAITAEQATSAANAAAQAAASGSSFPLSVSDALRLAGIAATVVGGANAISGVGGSSGTGGFDIVPVPSDWKSPPPTTVAEYTPLAPIDFGNKQMLQGTQWEKLLSPTYNQAAPMPNPAVSTNPSNMSFDQLMGVLGNTRTAIPTQNVSINDVIAGIQSQYGQTPQGAVG
jgi:hypothetical protein